MSSSKSKITSYLKQPLFSREEREHKFLLGSERSFSIKDLQEIENERENILGYIAGKSIAIFLEDELQLSSWLILTESIVAELYILPVMSEEEMNNIFNSKLIDLVLTDRSIDVNIESINIHDQCSFPAKKKNTKNVKTNWVLPTSGTTGLPKFVPHSLSTLTRTTKKSKKSFIWGALYSIKRMAGIQVFLQAISSQNSKILIPDSSLGIDSKLDLFISHNVNCLSATPSMWRKILMNKKHMLMNLENITLGGEMSDQNILNKLKEAYPMARIRHIYATTEAGVIFSITDNKEGFPKSFINEKNRQPELKISKKSTLLVKLNSASKKYKITNTSIAYENNYIDTGDLVEIVGDRVLFRGRESGKINVGGNLVSPEKIENIIMMNEKIIMCKVIPKVSSIIGNILFCEIVLGSNVLDSKKFIEGLKIKLKKDLNDYEIPSLIRAVDNIELNETGKIIRK